MARHRKAQHRSHRPPWWIFPLAIVVIAAAVITPLELLPSDLPAPAVPPTRSSLTTPAASAYISALGKHGVAVEPNLALFLGDGVCAERKNHATLATLSANIRKWVPHISAIDAATLVDDADRNLCKEVR